MDKVRWGILGTGRIAHEFAADLRLAAGSALVAVGSRTVEAAQAFGDRHGLARRHASYQALVDDPEVDVIYVATPHSLHAANCLLALQADKHVLCEKPFAIHAAEAADVIDAARARRRFLMEAMWMRFLPAVKQVRALLEQAALGEVLLLTADFGRRFDFNPSSRLFDRSLGGGALLDLGVYPLSLASMVFGPPQRIASLATIGETGVDEHDGMVLQYAGGRLAVLHTSMRATSPEEATLIGTEGYLRIHPPMHSPTKLTLVPQAGRERRWELPMRGNGLHYQAIEVMDCLRRGRLESETMPLDETLAIVQAMDQLRAQWGLRYPMEPPA